MSGATPFVLLLPAVLGFFGMSAGFQTAGWPVEVSAAPAGRADSIGDTLWSFRAPSSWPTGLAWDGDRLWLGDNDSDSLYRLTTEGVVEAAFPLFDSFPSPAGMTWIGNNLWMVDENTSTLYEIDPATGTPLKSFPLPDTSRDPSSWGLAWDGNYLWHSEYAHGKIYQLDTTDGRVVSWFAPPDSWILGLEYDGQYLWGVSIRSNHAFLMSLPSGTLVQTYPWKVPYPLGLAL
ncbi:MAG: hypothetical protein ABIK37_03165, partial [candidate division WOR-3 bacterium]